ncbi:MAG: MarR family transcriptional regulator [Chthoniobacteraceae bacterium]
MSFDEDWFHHNIYGLNIPIHMHDHRQDLKASAERLADIFIVLQRSFVLNLSKELVRGRLSFPQFLLLSFLAQEEEPLTMTEVARRMKHTTAAATGLVDRLEKLSLITRKQGPKDRRKVMVVITAQGHAMVQEIRQDMIQNLLRLMEHLDDTERATWVRIYEKIFPHCNK